MEKQELTVYEALKDLSKEEIINAIACADVNLDTIARMVPGLANDPFFRIVKFQLRGNQGEL